LERIYDFYTKLQVDDLWLSVFLDFHVWTVSYTTPSQTRLAGKHRPPSVPYWGFTSKHRGREQNQSTIARKTPFTGKKVYGLVQVSFTGNFWRRTDIQSSHFLFSLL